MKKEEVLKILSKNKYETDNGGYLEYPIEVIDFEFCKNIINKIYNSFENRTCQNCKYFKDATECRNPYNKQYYYCDEEELGMTMTVCRDFACNLFENK